jgi:capsule polysaccharide export protein KpsE/RkpR
MRDTPKPIDLSFLRDRKAQKTIALMTGAVFLLGLLYACIAPRWYRAVLTVVPAKSQKGGGFSAMLGGELAGLASGLADSAGIGGDVQRIAAVLQSNDVSDTAIARFSLQKRYSAKYRESAREALWKHCEVKALPKPSLVQLSCEDKDPRFVQELLEFFAEYGNQVFRRVGVSSATEQVRFLEKRVGELRVQADESAAKVREFQEQYQIIDLETQTKAVVGSMASLNSQRISKQLELDYARTFSSGDEASLKQLESQISVVDRKLKAMEEDPDVPANPDRRPSSRRATTGMFPAALTVPKLRAQYEALYRDRKVAESTLVFALERLEAARADEARETSTFLVLDPPALPTRPIWPKRSFIVLGATMFGLAVGLALAWMRANGGTQALRSLLADVTDPRDETSRSA